MRRIRVLVANGPRLSRELLIATVSDQPDIEVVGEIQEESEIVAELEKSHPDFLIVALLKSDRLPDVCHSILQSHPQVKVIGIAPDLKTSVFYWTSLLIQSNHIEASEEGVLRALRSSSRHLAGVQ